MEIHSSIFTVDFATLAAKNHGKLIYSSSSGLPPRESAVHVSCMCCKNTTLVSIGAWRSFGPSLPRLAKKELRCRSCFPIRPDSALWMRELIYSITAPLSERSNHKSHCGRREPHMVITPEPLDS